MPRLVWNPAALRDMDRLHDFLASKNKGAAQRAVRAIRLAVKTLRLHPEIGRPVEGELVELREWVVEFGQGSYVVLYRTDGDEVVLLGVRHRREDGY